MRCNETGPRCSSGEGFVLQAGFGGAGGQVREGPPPSPPFRRLGLGPGHSVVASEEPLRMLPRTAPVGCHRHPAAAPPPRPTAATPHGGPSAGRILALERSDRPWRPTCVEQWCALVSPEELLRRVSCDLSCSELVGAVRVIRIECQNRFWTELGYIEGRF